jgi:DNA-binding Lrp family transcriptional regulator
MQGVVSEYRSCRGEALRSSSLGGVVVVQAYVLIQTEVGKAARVAEAIAGISGVTMAEDVTGPYDVIARVEARTVDDLGKLVIAKIQDVVGITRTLTCTIVHI